MKELSTFKPMMINGVSFTSREFDILACLVSGRRIKTIASFLTIAPKTVETHIRNLMLKIDCNSQESIITFIEKSGQLEVIKQHYLSILTRDAFAQSLKKIGQLIHEDPCASITINAEEGQQARNLQHKLEEYFKKIGIVTTTQIRQILKTSEETKENENKVLYIVPEQSFKNLQATKYEENQRGNNNFLANNIFLIVCNANEAELLNTFNEMNCVDFREPNNSYFAFFELLTKLFPSLKLESISNAFKQQCNMTLNSDERVSSEQKTQFKQISAQDKNPLERFDKKKRAYLITSGLCLSALIILIAVFMGKQDDTFLLQSKNTTIKHIRSDLPLPIEENLLQRPKVLAEIKEKLSGDKGIQTVALVGIGGAGKTTLARQYAQTQKSSVVWEFNAETEETLLNSFEALAYSLAKTEEEIRILKELQVIKELKERKEKLVIFVRGLLNDRVAWLLIYDNVEKFSDIQKYFPSDSNTWGHGKLIVTTRNSNICNNSYLSNVINVDELSPDEKLALFTKIIKNDKAYQFKNFQNERANEFLKKIPPFPLDISIAAYYLKSTNVSDKEYLEKLNRCNTEFIKIQENILKEAGDYTKTRYSIISLSLMQLLDTHPDFKNLLLFVSLIDSQNIPRSLLDTYKGSVVVDLFIHNLNKYSLIIKNSVPSPYSTSSFSIHRSTQEIIQDYLIKTLDRKNKSLLIESASTVLGNYIENAIINVDFLILRILGIHCVTFLTHGELLTKKSKGLIEGRLGCIYFYLGHYEKAIQVFEDSLQNLDEHDLKDRGQMAQFLAYHGMVYRRLGNYEKAKNLIEQSLIIYRKDLTHNYAEYFRTLIQLSIVYRELGDYKRAQDILEQDLIVYKRNFDKNYFDIAWALTCLGDVQRYLGNYEKAQTLLQQSIAIYKEKLPETHIEIAWPSLHLGNVYRSLGNYKEAENLIKQSFLIFKEHYGKDHINTAWALGCWGKIYRDLGYTEKAKDFLKQSLLIHEKYFGKNHIVVTRILEYLGEVYNDSGQYEKAKGLFDQTLEIHEKYFGKDHVASAFVLNNLAQTYYLEGKLQNAENLMIKALKIFQEDNHPEAYKCFEILVKLYLKRSEEATTKGDVQQAKNFKTQAINYLKQALAIAKSHFPKDSLHLLKIQEKLKNLAVT